MKKLLTLAAMFTAIALSSCKYDDDDLWSSVHGLEDRVAKLEELCKQMNTNIVSLQAIVNVLQESDYITGVAPVMQDGKEVGYIITFSKSNPVTIYHGKDGQDGEDGTDGNDGTTPSIGVKQDTDGIYYWTLNGEWLTDDQGKKIKAEGVDGNDGTDGDDGVTPRFKIENEYWYISYNNGESWEQLGKATGGESTGGDSMFTDIDYKTSTDYVIFTLADGTQIKLPTWSAFEALQRLCNETNTNLSSLQAIVTALQNNDYITSVDPLTENGKVVGYTIKFAKSNPIVIYNGKDGADGNTPVIGIKKDTDGIYYWTLDGEFILVDGHKIQAQGDGNGTTPKLEIRNGYWWVSYDNGQNWEQLGKATGEDGKDGESIKITQDENNVYFELEDGTVITIPKSGQSGGTNIIQFEDENVKNLCVATWDTDGDGELSYDEAAAVTTLGTVFKGNTEIQSFNELRYFTGLTALDDTFNGCTSLRRITIPVNVKTIGVTTFRSCIQLLRIMFEKGAKLGVIQGDTSTSFRGTFSDCTALIAIEIPASVRGIETAAFNGCSSLTTVTFEEGSQLKTISGYYFKSSTSNDYYGSGAFSNCTALTSIEIPASVETIGAAAFKGCSSLATVTFEKGSQLKTIGGGYLNTSYGFYGAFSNCTALKTIEIPASVETIKAAAFYGCSYLDSVTFEKGSLLKTIGGFSHSSPSVTLGYGAFAKLKNLDTVDMSECTLVETIENDSFRDDSNLLLFKIGTRTPPKTGSNIFDGINTNSLLKVPSGCVNTYRQYPWSKFAYITELDE